MVDMWQVLVKSRSRDQLMSHEFSVVLDADFHRFMMLVATRLDVVRMIAHGLGDPHASTHVRITRLDRGLVTLCWTNTSLTASRRHPGCQLPVRTTLLVC